MTVKSLRKQLAAAIAMTLVATVALGSSTYAWFVNNAQVTATNVNVQAATAYSLLISQDQSSWGTTTALDALTNKLTPVSTTGEIADEAITLSAASGENPAIGIGDNSTVAVGDVRFATGTKWENNYMTEFSEVSKTSSTAAADASYTSKYFYSEEVYLKAAQASKLLLDSNGIKVVWQTYDASEASSYSIDDFMALQKQNAEASDSAKAAKDEYDAKLTSAQALIKTLRVGFMITKYTGGVTSGAVSDRKFFEYQLVSAYINDSTKSFTTSDASTQAEGLTKAIKASTLAAAEIKIASGTMQGKTITDYAADGSQLSMVATADQSGKDVLSEMAVNEVVKCDIYVWMEGCDEDTVAANINSFAGTGLSGLQFGFCLGE